LTSRFDWGRYRRAEGEAITKPGRLVDARSRLPSEGQRRTSSSSGIEVGTPGGLFKLIKKCNN